MTATPDWVPDACTLPTAEQPLRLAEFTTLFASWLREADRHDPTRLRLTLAAEAHAETVRLTEAESACCSFFTFTLGDPVGDHFTLDIDVPASRADVLDGLAAHAVTAPKSPPSPA